MDNLADVVDRLLIIQMCQNVQGVICFFEYSKTETLIQIRNLYIANSEYLPEVHSLLLLYQSLLGPYTGVYLRNEQSN